MRTLGTFSPSRFADVMTYPKGYKSPDGLQAFSKYLQDEQSKRVKAGRKTTKVFSDTADQIESIHYQLANWLPEYEFGDTALTYAKEVALGRLGVAMPEVKAKPLDHGKENEPEALRIYNKITGAEAFKPEIRQVYGDYITGECDGLIGEDGLIEIKCPYNPINHLNNLLTWDQLELYKWQIQGYLMIYDRQWCDFVSFNPDFPDWNTQIGWTRVERDPVMIIELEKRIDKLNTITENYYEQIVSGVFRSC